MSDEQRYVIEQSSKYGYGVIDLKEGVGCFSSNWTELQAMSTKERILSGDHNWSWLPCKKFGLDINELRRKHNYGYEQPQSRLPQVGEVWRSRDGEFTIKLEPNKTPSLVDGYVFCGRCSNNIYRTFTAEGTYWNDGSESGEDLIELVPEAPATPVLPQENMDLQVSIIRSTTIVVKDEDTGVSVTADDSCVIKVTDDEFNTSVPKNRDTILAVSRCLAKLHEVLTKESGQC